MLEISVKHLGCTVLCPVGSREIAGPCGFEWSPVVLPMMGCRKREKKKNDGDGDDVDEGWLTMETVMKKSEFFEVDVLLFEFARPGQAGLGWGCLSLSKWQCQ